MTKPTTIDEYIATFPDNVRTVLQEVRQTIRAAAPDAVEAISYAIPTFKLAGKNLVHFAAFASHIGFYATPDGQSAFADELSGYQGGKGSVQFPLSQPVPLDLIRRIVLFRVAQVKQE